MWQMLLNNPYMSMMQAVTTITVATCNYCSYYLVTTGSLKEKRFIHLQFLSGC